MASIFFRYYADVQKKADAAVKKEYGVSKAMVLKVLEKLFVDEITSSGKKTVATVKKAGKPGKKRAKKALKKPGKRGRKPGRKPGKTPIAAKKPAKRGRKAQSAKQTVAPKIEVS